jgi:MoaA/NifB/PqqE/SkfB family radical SAM enzyme
VREPAVGHGRKLVRLAAGAAVAALSSQRALYCLWEITHRCNARCAMCALWRRPARAADELSLDAIEAILDRLWAHGCRALNLSGGEPTLRDDLEGIVLAAARRGFWTSMVSNGSGLTRARVAALRQAGLDSLLVSVDAADARVHDRRRGMPGSHAQAMRCLGWLDEEFLSGHRTGGMMVVLSRENLSDLGVLLDLARRLRVSVAVQPYHARKTGAGDAMLRLPPETLEILGEASRERRLLLSSRRYLASLGDPARAAVRPCRAGGAYFSIDPYGGLHPCVDQPAVGHVLRDDFAVLRSAAARSCVQACSGCWYSFRGETDLALTPAGYLDKLRLALAMGRRAPRRRVSGTIDPSVTVLTPDPSDKGVLSCEEV